MKHEQHWADPIERPTPKVIRVYVWLLCLAAVGMLAWRLWP